MRKPKRQKDEWPVTYKIRTKGSSWDCFIFPDKRRMMRHMRRTGYSGESFAAACIPSIRVLVFSAKNLGAGVVAHEVAHAAIAVAGVGKRPTRDQEEEFCDVVERIVDGFWGGFWKYFCIKNGEPCRKH